jgi:hypothetical protein
MLNEIQVGRINGLLHKLLDMKEGAPAPTLATDIFPTIALEVDRPEWKFLGGERLCQAQWNDAAAAGNYSSIGLRVPAGAGVLVVIKAIYVIYGATADFYMGLRPNTTVDGARGGRCRDSRLAVATSAAQIVDRTQATALAYQTFHGVALANTLVKLDTPWVLTPGYELMIWPSAQNTAQTACFDFTERNLEPSETR